jgi:D-alanyl-D-alanine carboxypeptidase
MQSQLEAVLRAGVPGVVVASTGPERSWEGAAGAADAKTATPLTLDHRFLIGSVTKTFVAAVVLQLVGEGALVLDEQVGPIAEGVTLRQLLNHTSGLPDYYDDFDSLIEPYRTDRAHEPNLTPRAALDLVHAKPRLFPPGEGWRTRAATTSRSG